MTSPLPLPRTLVVLATLAALGLALAGGLAVTTAEADPAPAPDPISAAPPPPPRPGTPIGVLGLDGEPLLGPDGDPLTVPLGATPPAPVPAEDRPEAAPPTRGTVVVDILDAHARTVRELAEANDLSAADRRDLYLEAGVLWPAAGSGVEDTGCGATASPRWDGPAAAWVEPAAAAEAEAPC